MQRSALLSLALAGLAAAQDPCAVGGYPCTVGGFANALTPGNILAIRVGSAAGPDMRAKATATDGIIGPTFMDEIDPTGVLVQSLDLGSLSVPIRQTLFTGGTGPSEGLITTSYNSKYVIFGGYNAPIGWQVMTGPSGGGLPTIGANAQYRQSTWPAGWNYPPRIMARVGKDGKVAIIAQDYNFALGDTLRSTCSADGVSGYMVGHAIQPVYNNGTAMPAAVLAPVMYYAGRGAAGVPIINASLATSTDLGGNARGCLISDVLTPGKPQLYLTVHTKYEFRWDTGVRTVTGVTPTVADACSCATNPANPKVACSLQGGVVETCNYVTHNADRGVFQVVAPNGDQLSSLPTTISAYAGLPGISADSRVNPDKMLTSQMNFERYCNFYLAAPDLMYISDAAYNSNTAQNWYAAQTNKLNWAPGIHRYKKTNGVWSFSPETQGPSNMSGGIIDGGYAANDLTIGQCRGETYVFWASADFQNSKNANPHTSLGSRLRYYKPSNGDVNTFANSANIYGLSQSNINSIMWRGIQWVPCTDTSNTCPGLKTNTKDICATSASSDATSSFVGAAAAAVAAAGAVAQLL